MKKVGILTMFYNSCNYGGCLQAYALAKYLENEGVDTQQINYRKTSTVTAKINKIRRLVSLNPAVLFEKVNRRVLGKLGNEKCRKCEDFSPDGVKVREEVFADFRKNFVKSSDKVYTANDISKTNDIYGAFVVGSDQVWNEVTDDSPYLLGFVADGKLKVSYAASISQEKLSRYAKSTFRKRLATFDAVSVREKQGRELLQECGCRDVKWVLDPTFLLEMEEWQKLTKKPKIDSPYILCYFLGSDKEHRDAAKKYALDRKLKVVTLPFLQNVPNTADDGFGDEKLWDASPTDFLSLIANADAVFTDSFHATVFSCIFKKKFFVFARSGGKTNSRMKDLLDLMGLSQRYCLPNTAAEDSLPEIDYDNISESFDNMRQFSKDFIKSNIIEKL